MNRFAIVLPIVFALSSGCKDLGIAVATPPEGQPFPRLPDMLGTWSGEDEIIPMTVGNNWEYVDSAYYPNGSKEARRETRRVIGRTRILYLTDSVDVFILRFGSDTDFFVRNEHDGFWQYTYQEAALPGDYNLKSMWIKYPISPGDRFNIEHGDYMDRFECSSTDTVIATPVARVRSLYVRERLDGRWYKFFRPGVGLISESFTTTDLRGDTVFKRWLISYSIH